MPLKTIDTPGQGTPQVSAELTMKPNKEMRVSSAYKGQVQVQDLVMTYPCMIVFNKLTNNYSCIALPELTDDSEIISIYLKEE